MKFAAIVKLHPGITNYNAYLKIREEMGGDDSVWNLPKGVKILDSLHCLSQHGLIVFYEAPDGETAERFLKELAPVASINRILGIPCGICERTKEMQ